MKDNEKKRNLYIYLPDLPPKLRRKVIKWWKAKKREEGDLDIMEKHGGFSILHE